MKLPFSLRLSSFVCLLAGAIFLSGPAAAAADPALTASFAIRTQAPYVEGSSPVFAATVDGKRKGYTYVYDWNFGQGGGWEKRSLEPANLFFDNGNYVVAFRVTELRNGSQVRRVESAPRTINIQNVAPGGNITGAPAQSAEGVEITVNSTVSDAGRDDRGHLRRAWVVLGGPSSTGRAGSTSPRFIFTPTDSGNYTVAVDVTDKDGATTRITRSIHVGNEAPTGHAGGPYVAANGRPMQVLGTIDDASPADLAHLDVSWNFGDGTEPQSGLSPTHTYAAGVAPGRKNITMTITDPDGGTQVVNTWATLAAAPSFRQPNGIFSLSDNDGWLSAHLARQPARRRRQPAGPLEHARAAARQLRLDHARRPFRARRSRGQARLAVHLRGRINAQLGVRGRCRRVHVPRRQRNRQDPGALGSRLPRPLEGADRSGRPPLLLT